MKQRFDFSHWKLLTRQLQHLTLALAGCYGLSYLARLHWFFDLFSHFAFQYAIGGLLLLGGLALVRSWKCASAAALIAILNIAALYHNTSPTDDSYLTKLTVMQYNRNVGPTNQDALEKWLRAHIWQIDIVVLQEANASVARMARDLADIFPAQLSAPRDHAFGMVVLSRYPFIATKTISFPYKDENGKPRPAGVPDDPGIIFANFALQFTVQPPLMKEPVTVFALHAIPPMGRDEWTQRNYELATVAALTNTAPQGHRLMMGDWNISPYSPFYNDVLKSSGLRRQVPALPPPTWPTLGIPWIMQIPIDHILSDQSLVLLNYHRAMPAFSDHYAVIAAFGEN